MNVKHLTRFIQLALISSTLGWAFIQPAMAQEIEAEADEEESFEEVVVTGTRIAKRDAIADSPIHTIDQEAFRDSGFVTVDQYLNTMPQFVPNLGSQSNNPSSNGRAFIDLRGLGINRNLVLIDGRRGMGSTAGGVVDVNTIPAALDAAFGADACTRNGGYAGIGFNRLYCTGYQPVPAAAGSAIYFQPAGQATGITGGNPDLTPEKVDSWNFGVVVTEPFGVDMLSFTVDYFNIDLEDVIQAVNAQTIVQRCFNRDGANPSYSASNSWCQLFTRDQSNGGVIGLKQLSQNQAFIKTDGIDFTVNYGLTVGPGDLMFQMLTSWVNSFENLTTSVEPVFDFAGTIGTTTGSSAPEWKINFVTSYDWNDFRGQVTGRYIDGMKHANVVTGGSPETNTSISAVTYRDLMGSYQVTRNLTLRLGVNNVFDQDPELYTPFVQANTDPSLYDVPGRRYFFGLNWQM